MTANSQPAPKGRPAYGNFPRAAPLFRRPISSWDRLKPRSFRTPAGTAKNTDPADRPAASRPFGLQRPDSSSTGDGNVHRRPWAGWRAARRLGFGREIPAIRLESLSENAEAAPS